MQVQILKPFSEPDSPNPFNPGELLTVDNVTAKRWIAAGNAVPLLRNGFAPAAAPGSRIAPARVPREKAVLA